jgi:hypothetical protein
MSAKIFQKRKSHLKIIGSKWVMWSKFPSNDREMLGTTKQNLDTTAACCSWQVYP